MWMTLLGGRHVSSDVAVVDGEPRWWRHVTGEPGPGQAHAGDFHETAAKLIVRCEAGQLLINHLLAVDQLVRVIEQVTQFGNERV